MFCFFDFGFVADKELIRKLIRYVEIYFDKDNSEIDFLFNHVFAKKHNLPSF